MAIEPKHKVEVRINIRNVTKDNLSSAFFSWLHKACLRVCAHVIMATVWGLAAELINLSYVYRFEKLPVTRTNRVFAVRCLSAGSLEMF